VSKGRGGKGWLLYWGKRGSRPQRRGTLAAERVRTRVEESQLSDEETQSRGEKRETRKDLKDDTFSGLRKGKCMVRTKRFQNTKNGSRAKCVSTGGKGK